MWKELTEEESCQRKEPYFCVKTHSQTQSLILLRILTQKKKKKHNTFQSCAELKSEGKLSQDLWT